MVCGRGESLSLHMFGIWFLPSTKPSHVCTEFGRAVYSLGSDTFVSLAIIYSFRIDSRGSSTIHNLFCLTRSNKFALTMTHYYYYSSPNASPVKLKRSQLFSPGIATEPMSVSNATHSFHSILSIYRMEEIKKFRVRTFSLAVGCVVESSANE